MAFPTTNLIGRWEFAAGDTWDDSAGTDPIADGEGVGHVDALAGPDLTQSTTADQPVWNDSNGTLNDWPSVAVDRSTAEYFVLDSSLAMGTGDKTFGWYCVYSSFPGNAMIFSKGSNPDTAHIDQRNNFISYRHDDGTSVNIFPGATTLSTGTAYVVMVVQSGSNITAYVDDVLWKASTITAAEFTINRLFMGFTTSLAADGEWAGLAVWDAALGSTARTDFYDYWTSTASGGVAPLAHHHRQQMMGR